MSSTNSALTIATSGAPASEESTMNRTDLPVVVFDGDDTLWITEPLYDAARRAARGVVETVGLNGSAWEDLQREIDVGNIPKFGLSAARFPTSCRQAYEQLCAQVGRPPEQNTADEVYSQAAQVFRQVAPLAPGALEVVTALRASHRVVLLTQGDVAVQDKRVDDSGLEPLFDLIRIVPKKDAATLRKLLRDLGVDAASAWMVGNSVPSDVNPALAVGMRAIWVDAHVWEHEKREQASSRDGLTEIDALTQIPNVIGS
jgi:putative hydrolase of the HAD superfamily